MFRHLSTVWQQALTACQLPLLLALRVLCTRLGTTNWKVRAIYQQRSEVLAEKLKQLALSLTADRLTAAGGLAAALSTADGLLLTIANSLRHDLYFKNDQSRYVHCQPGKRIENFAAYGGIAGSLNGSAKASGCSVSGVGCFFICCGFIFSSAVLGDSV